jgi:uncharacterized protein YndB with AHSA1/START domain
VLRHDHTIEIARRAAELFPYLVEPEHVRRWTGGSSVSEPLTEGPPRLGSRSRETVDAYGVRTTIEIEIARYEPPHALDLAVSGRVFGSLSSYRLAEVAGPATELTAALETELKLPGAEMLEPFAAARIERHFHESLARLKEVAEGDAGQSDSAVAG